MRVATHRATRLAATGATDVVDLGCGIGGDLVAMARAGLRVRGVELDPVRAAIAAANLRALELDGDVIRGDARSVDIGKEAPGHRPARRDGRGRTFSTSDLQPPWDWVRQLLGGPGRGQGHAGSRPRRGAARRRGRMGQRRRQSRRGMPVGRAVRDRHPPGHRAARPAPGWSRPASRGGLGRRRHTSTSPTTRSSAAGLVGELAATIGGWLPDSAHRVRRVGRRACDTPGARVPDRRRAAVPGEAAQGRPAGAADRAP